MAMLIPAYTMRFGQSFGWGGMMIFNPSDLAATFRDLCGTGVDGEIVRSGNGNESYLFAKSYTVESGVTITASGNALFIFAKDFIEIAGTLTASEKGANGGAAVGGGSGSNQGLPGGNALMGGRGGDGGDVDGMAYYGGAGGTLTGQEDFFSHYLHPYLWELLQQDHAAGSGGGSGAEDTNEPPYSGAGGKGGGFIVLFSPRVSITGTVNVTGAAGGASGGARCAGGGGGGGGLVWIVTRNLADGSATYSLAGGAGGAGDGGDGLPGEAGDVGILKKLIVK